MANEAAGATSAIADKRELVLGVLATLGGDTRSVCLDEIALACHRLAPAVFAWPEYSWLPQLDNVRVNLHHVTKKGLVHRDDKFYRLTEAGIQWCKAHSRFLEELRGRIPDPMVTSRWSAADLVAVALLNLTHHGDAVPRERLIAEAFRVFPETFGLAAFPGWPDAARVDTAVAQCPFIEIADGGLRLNPENVSQVEAYTKALQTRSSQFRSERRASSGGSASKAIVRIERSRSYRAFGSNRTTANISDGEVCDLLSVTLEAPPGLVRARIDTLRVLVEQAERRDLLDYINWITDWLAARDWILAAAGDEGDRNGN